MSRRITAPSRSAGPTSSSLCHNVIHDDEEVFEQLVRRLGISIDWSFLYTTIGESSQRVSQLAFLHNLARGEAYQQDAPTLYDIDERTAVAQAEMEDRDVPGRVPQARVPSQ